MISTTIRLLCAGALLGGTIGYAASPAFSHVAASRTGQTTADAQVDEIADALLAHLQKTELSVRVDAGLPITSLDDLTPAAAERNAHFYSGLLARISPIDPGTLSHEHWILAGLLKHEAEFGSHAVEDYWLNLAVTPYTFGWTVPAAGRAVATQPVADEAQRQNYLHLLDDYARMVDEVTAKTQAQAARGIRVPQPAIAGVRATLSGSRDAAVQTLAPSPERLAQIDEKSRKAFADAVAARIATKIVPAYARLLAIFDDRYVAHAPIAVGLGQYPGGAESYQRRIFYYTGLRLTPREIHARGLAEVERIEDRLAAIRAQLGFKATRADFEAQLRTDPRFFAKDPAELEKYYLQFVARTAAKVPQYFSKLPVAGYGVKRVDLAAESGMTFGYYQRPSASEPLGYYRYNASNLDKRSLIMAPHLIYHELIPGHHFQMALMGEDKTLHPVRNLLSYPAFTEGWAEYAAELAGEMGGYPTPYELYGHLLTQQFMASRLVVDSGMNALGWPIERARQFLRAHGAESDELAATETLRYSTDLYGQALGYRIGYDQFWAVRQKAEQALGKDFDIRDFHATTLTHGVMPMNILAGHIDWFIAQTKRSTAK